MDNDQNVNASGAIGDFIMKSPDLVESSGSQNDILTRRLKNRERQRRYRARKRLEADMKRNCVVDRSSSSAVELEPNGYHYNCIPHRRNWKRDARRAHESPTTSISSVPASNVDIEALCLAAEIVAEPHMERKSHAEDSLSLPITETCTINHSRRDWKTEARNNMK